MTSPAYLESVYDSELRGLPHSVYLVLYHGTPEEHYHDALSPVSWRPVKHLALTSRFGCAESTMYLAIAVLLQRGYLERQRVASGPRLYRIVHSRMPDDLRCRIFDA